MLLHEAGDKLLLCLHLLADFFEVIKVISHRAIDIAECDARQLRDDFVYTHPQSFMANDDVNDAHPMTGNARLAAADARRFSDAFSHETGHRLLSFGFSITQTDC